MDEREILRNRGAFGAGAADWRRRNISRSAAFRRRMPAVFFAEK
jgi:hypothetical protein